MTDKIVKDKIGQVLNVGSIVASPHAKTELKIGRVVKLAPKQAKIEDVNNPSGSTWYKYHHEVVCLDALDQTLMYMLSRGIEAK